MITMMMMTKKKVMLGEKNRGFGRHERRCRASECL
jgi:hypothetical protein